MIQKDAVGDYFECSKLSGAEIFGAAGTALILFFLAAIPSIIQHYHLSDAAEQLLHGAGDTTRHVLAKLDSLSFTNTLVTFLFWGVVGIFIYGLTATLVHLWQAGEEDTELASDEYVHPVGFSKGRFWKQIVSKELFSAAILLAELIVVSATIFWAFPLGLARVALLLQSFSWMSLFAVVGWSVAVATLFCLIYLVFKGWRYRHILFTV